MSIDVEAGKAMAAMDLTSLRLGDDTQTLVYCSNVLEHIPDDLAAMREMRRVLRSGGYAVIQVPIRGETTDEDLTIVDPQARLERYTQIDHVRFYGLDVTDRLRSSGFTVETLDASQLPDAVVERHALSYPTTRQVFLCT